MTEQQRPWEQVLGEAMRSARGLISVPEMVNRIAACPDVDPHLNVDKNFIDRTEDGRTVKQGRLRLRIRTLAQAYERVLSLPEGELTELIPPEGPAEWASAPPVDEEIVLRESDYDRTYELIDARWAFRPSATDSSTWDATYQIRRIVRANWADGLSVLATDIGRSSDDQLPFTEDNHPSLKVVDSTRRSQGTITLAAEPRKRTGATFVQDVIISPPAAQHEPIDVTVRTELLCHKYAFREDHAAATINAKGGVRTTDWCSRNVSYPTRRLRYEVFLPLSLHATPEGLRVARADIRHPDMEQAIRDAGQFSLERVNRGDDDGWLMVLDIERPRLRTSYGLCWTAPSRNNH